MSGQVPTPRVFRMLAWPCPSPTISPLPSSALSPPFLRNLPIERRGKAHPAQRVLEKVSSALQPWTGSGAAQAGGVRAGSGGVEGTADLHHSDLGHLADALALDHLELRAGREHEQTLLFVRVLRERHDVHRRLHLERDQSRAAAELLHEVARDALVRRAPAEM
eukprot:6430737-Prymnesium_polylepis.1